MRVEVLQIGDCPNGPEAARRVRSALDATGHGDVEVDIVMIESAQDAGRVAFSGSPTVAVDGEDLFPGAGRTTSLACRVYPTPAGLRGVPTVEQLTDALTRRV